MKDITIIKAVVVFVVIMVIAIYKVYTRADDTVCPQELYIYDRIWETMTEEQRYEADIELKARAVRMTVEEFELMSRVVEAESDRSGNLEGRVLIALTILNRVNSGTFPDNIYDVCYQPGQFQVVYEGTIWNIGRTRLSDWAIIEATRRINLGSYPNVMYFNNHDYNYGMPYCYEGGNYFVTV